MPASPDRILCCGVWVRVCTTKDVPKVIVRRVVAAAERAVKGGKKGRERGSGAKTELKRARLYLVSIISARTISYPASLILTSLSARVRVSNCAARLSPPPRRWPVYNFATPAIGLGFE